MELTTERLLLRPMRASDEADVFCYSREPDVGLHAGWKPHESLAETREILRTVFLGQEGVFAIVLKETGHVVGSVGLIGDPKRENPRARMLGYSLAKPCWGRGLMTEAVRAVLEWGFSDSALELVSAYCYPYNERSIRVLEKCGFVSEGTLRRCEVRYDGCVLDHRCYVLERGAARL